MSRVNLNKPPHMLISSPDIHDRGAEGDVHGQMQSDWLHSLESHRQFRVVEWLCVSITDADGAHKKGRIVPYTCAHSSFVTRNYNNTGRFY
jgi:hypothetical protein